MGGDLVDSLWYIRDIGFEWETCGKLSFRSLNYWYDTLVVRMLLISLIDCPWILITSVMALKVSLII